MVEKGAWTEIVSISAPSSAASGSQVTIGVQVKNLASYGIYLALTGVFDSTTLSLTPDYAGVNARATSSFSGSFTMPSKNVTVTIYSFYWTGTQWYLDDQKSVSISFQAAPPTGWNKVGEASLSISPTTAPPTGWTKLGEASLVITPSAVTPTWTKLGEASLTITPAVVSPTGWSKLGEASLTIQPGFEIPADYNLVDQKVYDDGKTYNGPAERCVASFSFLPTNFPGTKWFIDHLFADHIADKVKEQGEKPLTYKLYEKGTSYFIVIEATKTTAAATYVRHPFPWAAVIIAALVLAIVIVITVAIIKTEDFIYKAPGAAATITKWGLIALGIAGVVVVGIAISKGAIKGKEKKPAAYKPVASKEVRKGGLTKL